MVVHRHAGAGANEEALNIANPITSGLRQVLTLYSGALKPKAAPDGQTSKLKHTPLLSTGALSGMLDVEAAQKVLNRQSNLLREEGAPIGPQVIAMAIEGAQEAAAPAADAKDDKQSSGAATGSTGIKVVYTADLDLMLPVFLQLRAEPGQAQDLRFQFQNVTYLLNTIDYLTGELDFIDVRKHEPIFSSLRMIDSVKEEATSKVREDAKAYQEEYDQFVRDAQEANEKELQSLRETLAEMQKQSSDGKISRAVLQEKSQQFAIKQEQLQRSLEVKQARAERDREKSIREIRREADKRVTDIQNYVKGAAVSLPCIPPLVIGVIVFFSRRLRERESITKSRLK